LNPLANQRKINEKTSAVLAYTCSDNYNLVSSTPSTKRISMRETIDPSSYQTQSGRYVFFYHRTIQEWEQAKPYVDLKATINPDLTIAPTLDVEKRWNVKRDYFMVYDIKTNQYYSRS
jgi:hypothetical protein